MEDKYFNNLMTSYIEDYNKLKNKYHFKDDEDMKNTNIEIDKKDYDLKKQDINKIFSGNILDIKDSTELLNFHYPFLLYLTYLLLRFLLL